MHIANSCDSDIQHIKKNNRVKCKLSLEQILVSFCIVFPWFSDNFCRKHCLLTSLLMGSHLPRKQFPFFLNKTIYFHMHIYMSEFVIPLCFRYQVVHLAPVRNTVKMCNSWLLPHITIQPLTPVESLRNI